jgi:hypothetical protein
MMRGINSSDGGEKEQVLKPLDNEANFAWFLQS